MVLVAAAICPPTFADTATTIIYPFTGTKVSAEDAQLLTTKLKNILEQQGASYISAPEWHDGAKVLPSECVNRETAGTVKTISGAPCVVWGSIGEINDTYICSVYRLAAGTPEDRYEVFQEEVTGDLSDVLKYSIYNIAMKMTGQPDKVLVKPLPPPISQPTGATDLPVVSTPGQGFGELTINIDDDNAELFLDGKPVRSGDITLRMPAGMHRVTAKNAHATKTEVVEVINNEKSTLSLNLDENERNVRFFMGFDASWMLGAGIEFGPSHTVGLEIKKKHLLALDYYWGFEVFQSTIFGGGASYLYTFNVNDIFLARLGGGMGFWFESYWNYDEYYSTSQYPYEDYYSWDAMYFGGPQVRLEIGYKSVYFTMLDARLLIGPERVKVMLNSGISFRL